MRLLNLKMPIKLTCGILLIASSLSLTGCSILNNNPNKTTTNVAMGKPGDKLKWVRQDTESQDKGATISNIIYANNMYYAMSNTRSESKILSSSDAKSWKTIFTEPTDYHITNIEYGNNVIVALGYDHADKMPLTGFTMTSKDGIHWSEPSTDKFNTLSTLKFTGNLFFVLDNRGSTFISKDGTNWNESKTDVNNEYFSNIAYGNGLYVLIGSSGGLLTSTDGMNWTKGTVIKDRAGAIAYGNNTFMEVGTDGKIYTSTNGKDWVEKKEWAVEGNIDANKKNEYNIGFGNNNFVIATSNGDVITTLDGSNWTYQETGLTIKDWPKFHSILFANSSFLICGDRIAIKSK